MEINTSLHLSLSQKKKKENICKGNPTIKVKQNVSEEKRGNNRMQIGSDVY